MNLFNKTKKIHFIGIGGIGMSGMAEFLFNHGFQITGSDISISERTKHLSNLGINISYNHNKWDKYRIAYNNIQVFVAYNFTICQNLRKRKDY